VILLVLLKVENILQLKLAMVFNNPSGNSKALVKKQIFFVKVMEGKTLQILLSSGMGD
jgi:hypothetical protein